MSKPTKYLSIALAVVILGFGGGIYLQDLKHRESTEAAWKANRFNMLRFNKIMKYTVDMNAHNWGLMRDSIAQQLDSLMILRFRKEMDSINANKENK